MAKPRILDLFSGAGGAARGYHDAGFEVVGVDIAPQPNYPFEFVQHDALRTLEWLLDEGRLVVNPDDGYRLGDLDAIHASPPCQHYANVTSWRGSTDDHPDLLASTRGLLEQTGLPWVIENVHSAPLRGCHRLCGTMFGLRVRRHRFFETSWHDASLTPGCQHRPDDFSFDHGGKQPESVYRDAMGCGWMTVQESREAIPPAYTEFVGERLLAELQAKAAA